VQALLVIDLLDEGADASLGLLEIAVQPAVDLLAGYPCRGPVRGTSWKYAAAAVFWWP
jgi:hypothetical protein